MKRTRCMLLLVILMPFFIYSCKKDGINMSSDLSIINESNQVDENFIKSIEWFMEGADNVKEGKVLKNYSKISIESALTYIDGTLNYKYCFHNHRYGDLKKITVTINIPIISAEGKTLLVDAMQACNEAELALHDEYINLQLQNKKLVGIVLEDAEIDFVNEKIAVQLTGLVGINSPPIQTSDEYYYIRDSGPCDNPAAGTMGAPNVIENGIIDILLEQPQFQQRIVRTNLSRSSYTEPTLYINPNESDIIDNECDYQIFYATSAIIDNQVPFIPDDIKCLGNVVNGFFTNEIDYYISGISDIISYDLNLNNQSFQGVCIYNHDETLGTVLTIWHSVEVYTGKNNFVSLSYYPINIDEKI